VIGERQFQERLRSEQQCESCDSQITGQIEQTAPCPGHYFSLRVPVYIDRCECEIVGPGDLALSC